MPTKNSQPGFFSLWCLGRIEPHATRMQVKITPPLPLWYSSLEQLLQTLEISGEGEKKETKHVDLVAEGVGFKSQINVDKNNESGCHVIEMNPSLDIPILSSSNSAANKDMMSKIWTDRDTII